MGDILTERMESRTNVTTLKSHMQLNPLEWPWEGDNGKYLLNLWRQEGFLSLEATENVKKFAKFGSDGKRDEILDTG